MRTKLALPLVLVALASGAFIALTIHTFGLGGFAAADTPPAAAGEDAPAPPPLVSAGALELGPDGILFVADSEGAAVYAFEVGPAPAAVGEPMERLEDLDGKLAAMLGTGPRQLTFQDMAVDPATGTAYLSLMRGDGDGARPALFTVTRDGVVAELPLAGVRWSKVDIADPPPPEAELWIWKSRTLTVTDLELIDGELFIAGLSNEEFASTLRRAKYPFAAAPETVGLEIFHGAHGKLETHAPIFSFLPYTLGGEKALLAGYLCTPLVTFQLDELRRAERLRGKTLAELGWGNIPTDMVSYEHDGEGYLLVANNRRGTMKLRRADIEAAAAGSGITSEAEVRAGVDYQTVPLGAVLQLSDLDAGHVLVLGRSLEDGSAYLEARGKEWL